ncbi:hypothetical protein [Kitasatospora sp. LaBMicrA B282]|uniref:hypothetical protein n=1 Tax=Kitasatospora sp. LaBMicrA B282 TaxID=3420949 RepID=UPI003D149DEB
MSTLSQWLAGQGLRWDFIEAVIDVCSADSVIAQTRTAQARSIWDKSRGNPTPVATAAAVVGESALLLAKQEVIDLHVQLQQAMQALSSSQRAEANAGRLVVLLLGMISQLNLKIGELARQADRAHSQPSAPSDEEKRIRRRLAEAEEYRNRALREKERAEAKQREALELADQASREIDRLKAEVNRLNQTIAHDPGQAQEALQVTLGGDDIDALLGDVSTSLDKATQVNDTGDQLTWDARGALQSLEDATAPRTSAPSASAAGRSAFSSDPAGADNTNKSPTSTSLANNPRDEPSPTDLVRRRGGLLSRFRSGRAAERRLAQGMPLDSAHDVLELVYALQEAERHDAIKSLLAEAGNRLQRDELAQVAVGLEINDGFYMGPGAVVRAAARTRSVQDVAHLFVALDDAGVRPSFSSELLDEFGRSRQMADVLELAWSLQALGRDREAGSMLVNMARYWPARDSLGIAGRLRAEGYRGQALMLLSAVGQARPIDEVIVLVSELHAADRARDLKDVLGGACDREATQEVAGLIVTLHGLGRLDEAAGLLNDAGQHRPVAQVAEIVRRLDASGYLNSFEHATVGLPQQRETLIRKELERPATG